MAVFNEILSGRFNKGLNKLFSIKGPAPAPQLASEIMPVLPMFYGNECRYLEGWQRFGFNMAFTASAANVSFLRMRNPGGSLVVIVIEQVSLNFTATDEWKFRIDLVNSTDLATPLPAGQANSLDNRGPNQPSVHITTNQAPPSLVPNIEDVSGLLNTSYAVIAHQDDEITLLPDMQLTIQSSTLNSTARLSARWRERIIEESEALAKSGG